MYTLHIHNENIEILHLTAYQRKYINVVNSEYLYLSELEEMNICICPVETANAGMRL